ncbi:MAG TPA: hypothetical protein VF163_17840 [Micromonosporaceae bacterium]
MTPEIAAASLKWPLREIDHAWATSPITLRRARLLDLSGWAFYVAGRGGVLGDDARPETVAAAVGMIAADAVQAGWEAARKAGPAAVAAARVAECARWGDEHLSGLPELDRLVSLADRVVRAAEPAGLALFAAARAMPRPDAGPGGIAAVLCQLLQEHRAGALLIGVRACGLTAVEAMIAGPDGPAEAVASGWSPPFPPRLPLLRRFRYADALADRVAGQAYAVLTPAERMDLVGLISAAAHLIRT